MGLEKVYFLTSMNWTLSESITGFKSRGQGSDSNQYTINPDTETYNVHVGKQFELAASATQTIDLYDVMDLLKTSYTVTKGIILYLVFTGANGVMKLEPGTSNGLTWFLSGTTPAITIPAPGCFVVGQELSQVIDATHRNLKFTNTGTANLTVTLLFVGGE